MTKDVLVSINGKRMMGVESEDVELIIPGVYSRQGDLHTVKYDEPVEGMEGVTKNTILIGSGSMEIIKEGLATARMTFLNNDKPTVTCYSTPFGDFMIGIRTSDLDIKSTKDRLHVSVSYSMDVGEEHLSDCCMNIDIRSKKNADIHLIQ